MQFIQFIQSHNHLKAHIFHSCEETRKYKCHLFIYFIAFTQFIYIHYKHIYKWARRPMKVSTVLPFVKYVGCFKDTYIHIHHIYTTTVQRNAYILTIWLFLHHFNCIQTD